MAQINNIINILAQNAGVYSPFTHMFYVLNGQSNGNGANKFSLDVKYSVNVSQNKIWSERYGVYESPTIARNVTDVFGADSHSTEVGFLHHYKNHIVRMTKTAVNGTALLFDWFAGSTLDNRALLNLTNAWNAKPTGKYLKVFEWNQWESSASRSEQAGYKQAFWDLVARREAICGRFDVIIIHKVNPTGYVWTNSNAGCVAILAIQNEIKNEDSRVILQDNDGKQWEVDNIHYSSSAQLAISLEIRTKLIEKLATL